MARLQILQLPEGANDDQPPFILVIDQAPRDENSCAFREDLVNNQIATGIGARHVLVFEDTVGIPANEPTLLTEADDAERAGITQIVYAHERTRLDLCDALLLSRDTAWRKLIEVAAARQRDVATAYRKLDAAKEAPLRHKVALLDALGMDRTRDWDDILNAARGLGRDRDTQASALERVRNLPTEPELMNSEQEHPAVWSHGYRCGVLAARSAIRPLDEETRKP